MAKKTVALIGLFVFLISAVSSYSFFSQSVNKQTNNKIINPVNENGKITNGTETDTGEPKTEECPINGIMMTKKQRENWEKRRPLGIVVENSKAARPQSGLSSADVVYEAVAEGGITRFLGIYYCKDANYVGPVRSARVHFMKMLQEYGDYPLYAHVGGANCDAETGSGCANGAPADALGLIRDLGWLSYNDLSQFSVPFPVFWRDYERLPDRDTEHTVYTSTTKLWSYAKDNRKLTEVDEERKRWDVNFTKWKFKDGAAVDQRGNVDKISFGFWDSFAADYAVVWMYDKNTNNYVRANGEVPHIDKNTNKTIQSKNVIVMFAKESMANDGYNGGHILYRLTGTGDGLLFQNGKAEKITWTKEDEESRTIYNLSNGNEINIVRGQVFVEILPTGNEVKY